jgi:hypothetical protein
MSAIPEFRYDPSEPYQGSVVRFKEEVEIIPPPEEMPDEEEILEIVPHEPLVQMVQRDIRAFEPFEIERDPHLKSIHDTYVARCNRLWRIHCSVRFIAVPAFEAVGIVMIVLGANHPDKILLSIGSILVVLGALGCWVHRALPLPRSPFVMVPQRV